MLLNKTQLLPASCLTAEGGLLQFDKAMQLKLQGMLAVVTDEKCDVYFYISNDQRNNIHVVSLLRKYKMMGLLTDEQLQIKYTDIKTINQFYSGSGTAYASFDTSDIEREMINLIQAAASKKASDIHITITAANTVIQFRKFKRLQHFREELRSAGYALIQTMYNTMTDVADPMFKSTEAQDAVINNPAYLARNLNGVRVSIVPTTDGWNAVLRLLYQSTSGAVNSLEQLGYNSTQLNMIRKIKAKSTGVLIISGPTGSGKSTTLKVLLEEVAKDNGCNDDGTGCQINIMTVEDPSEYKILGAKQLAVSGAESGEERLEQYHNYLKALLRQDPDVIMIGEIRDKTSGQAAIKSAMTGHMCLTTIHTNDALGIIDRLIEMGIDESNVLNHGIVTGLVAQRLVPVLCNHCKVKLENHLDGYNEARLRRIREVFANDLTGINIRKVDGCDECNGLGISGVTVLAEIVKTDRNLMRLYKNGKSDEAYYYWRNQLDGNTLMEHGIEKIRQGICDPADIEAEMDELCIEDRKMKLVEVGA